MNELVMVLNKSNAIIGADAFKKKYVNV